ncbi:MAG TPA: DUF2726 domain-containing protein [Candidatus Binatia bacterium]|nr:DUF2726 domain-containing protein [Candidatus Binatia bacterium]
MGWFALASILLVVLAVLRAKLKALRGQTDEYPYTRKEILFSPAERSLLEILEQAVGGEYRIFSKVRIAHVVNVRAMRRRSVWQRASNRINGKHFDFILCAKDDLSIVGAVELDHRSRQSDSLPERDTFLDGLCQAIDLPLVKVQAGSAYSATELRKRIFGALRARTGAGVADWGQPLGRELEGEGPPKGSEVFSGGWTL